MDGMKFPIREARSSNLGKVGIETEGTETDGASSKLGKLAMAMLERTAASKRNENPLMVYTSASPMSISLSRRESEKRPKKELTTLSRAVLKNQ
jgi:hypothetical protein